LSGLQISKDLELPIEAATWTFADLGIKDSGKTYDAGDLAEEFLKNGIPILVLDGMGIWWGLRVGADKNGKPDPKKKGMPVVVFGGDHGDLPIPTRTEKGRDIVDTARLELMAKSILEAGISAVLDTRQFSKNMQRRIVAVFVNEVYQENAKYGVRHVFIEEADMWCPQHGMSGETAASTGAIDDLVRRGGNFNLGCTLITQRPAVLNKDVLTQAGCLLVHRVVHDLDKKAVSAWVRSMVSPDDKKFKKWFDSLNGLDNGEAWIWRPQKPFEIDPPKRIRFRPRETVHASREFFRRPEARTAKMGNVEEFIQKFQNVFAPKPKQVTPPQTAATNRPAPMMRPPDRPLPLIPTSGAHLPIPRPESTPIAETDAHVIVREPVAGVQTRMPTLAANDQEVTGQILYAAKQGAFDGEQRTSKDIVTLLGNFGWMHPKAAVDQGLLKLCDLKFFTRKLASNESWYYKLTPNAKDRIVLELVNAV
jgi:hypothetical protein